jgi:hypothetical protein
MYVDKIMSYMILIFHYVDVTGFSNSYIYIYIYKQELIKGVLKLTTSLYYDKNKIFMVYNITHTLLFITLSTNELNRQIALINMLPKRV